MDDESNPRPRGARKRQRDNVDGTSSHAGHGDVTNENLDPKERERLLERKRLLSKENYANMPPEKKAALNAKRRDNYQQSKVDKEASTDEPKKHTNENCILPEDAPSNGCSCSKASSCKTKKCEC
ncbi:unnamed protein product [Urochloa humidicola]